MNDMILQEREALRDLSQLMEASQNPGGGGAEKALARLMMARVMAEKALDAMYGVERQHLEMVNGELADGPGRYDRESGSVVERVRALEADAARAKAQLERERAEGVRLGRVIAKALDGIEKKIDVLLTNDVTFLRNKEALAHNERFYNKNSRRIYEIENSFLRYVFCSDELPMLKKQQEELKSAMADIQRGLEKFRSDVAAARASVMATVDGLRNQEAACRARQGALLEELRNIEEETEGCHGRSGRIVTQKEAHVRAQASYDAASAAWNTHKRILDQALGLFGSACSAESGSPEKGAAQALLAKALAEKVVSRVDRALTDRSCADPARNPRAFRLADAHLGFYREVLDRVVGLAS